MDLETFIQHADHFAALQRRLTRKAMLQALDGQESLRPSDADELAEFLQELSVDLSDEHAVDTLAEDIRETARRSYPG